MKPGMSVTEPISAAMAMPRAPDSAPQKTGDELFVEHGEHEAYEHQDGQKLGQNVFKGFPGLDERLTRFFFCLFGKESASRIKVTK